MPDPTGGTATMDELVKQLAGVAEGVETGLSGIRSDMKASETRATEATASIAAKLAAAEAQINELRSSLDKNRLSLPGLESEVQKGNLRLGHFLQAGAIARTNPAEAERQFPLVLEVHRQLVKHGPEDMVKRLLTTEVASGAGYLVAEQVSGEFIKKTYAGTALNAVGARSITGITGWPYIVNRQTGGATAYYIALGGALTASQLSTGRVTFSPKKLGCLTGLTREQITYSTPSALQLVEDDFQQAMGLLIDLKSIEGVGGQFEPLGLVNSPGVGAIDLTADLGFGAAANGRDLVDWIMKHIFNVVEESNALRGPASFGYILHTKLKNILKQQQVAFTNNGAAVLQNIGTSPTFGVGLMSDEQLKGIYGALGHSTQFASNLTVGTSSDGARIIAGNWLNFWSILWGGMVVDYSNTAVVGSDNAFTQDLQFVKVVTLHDCGPVRPTDFQIATGCRTVRTGV